MKYEEFNSANYLWDIDIDAMEIDELRALEQACRERRQHKEAEERYLKSLKSLAQLLEEVASNNA